MNKILTTLVLLLIVVVGAFFLFSNSKPSTTGNAVSEGENNNGIKIFTIRGENLKFVMNGMDNPNIKVSQGDKVRIEFTSTQGFHDWVLDEFNAATEKVRDTEGSTSIEFVANKKGTFEYYCSVGEHRANGMKGSFIVE